MRRRRSRGPIAGAVAAVLVVAAIVVVLPLARPRPIAPDGPYAAASLALDAAALGRAGVPLTAMQQDLLVRVVYPVDGAGHLVRRSGGAAAPVLLYVPGWPGTVDDNPGLVDDLASHGYVVAALRHAQPRPGLDDPMNFSTETAARDTLDRADRRAALGVEDAVTVLDALGRLDAAGGRVPFGGALQLSHVGIVGFSFGGAVAAAACARDPRFAAAVNLDGWLFGDGLGLHFPQPYFFIGDDEPPVSASDLASADPARRYPARLDARDIRLITERLSRPDGYAMTIRGSVHESFSDDPPHVSIWHRSLPGPIRGRRISRTIREYVNAFFDRTLLHGQAPLLNRQPPPRRDIEFRTSTS